MQILQLIAFCLRQGLTNECLNPNFQGQLLALRAWDFLSFNETNSGCVAPQVVIGCYLTAGTSRAAMDGSKVTKSTCEAFEITECFCSFWSFLQG